MLNQYFFDIPFYARLREPAQVVYDWSSADVRSRDDWRKELVDAADFGGAGGSKVLVEPKSLPAVLCEARVSWLIGARSMVTTYPFLSAARTVMVQRDVALWRLELGNPATAKAVGCATKAAEVQGAES